MQRHLVLKATCEFIWKGKKCGNSATATIYYERPHTILFSCDRHLVAFAKKDPSFLWFRELEAGRRRSAADIHTIYRYSQTYKENFDDRGNFIPPEERKAPEPTLKPTPEPTQKLPQEWVAFLGKHPAIAKQYEEFLKRKKAATAGQNHLAPSLD